MEIKTPTIDQVITRIKTSMSFDMEIDNTTFINELSRDYFFRGENSWFGEYSSSSLWRVLIKGKEDNPEAFKRKILVLINSLNKVSSTNEELINKMVKLRHEGIETPLLDLTSSFFVALFFAAIPMKNTNRGKCICRDNNNYRCRCKCDFTKQEKSKKGFIKLFEKKKFEKRDYSGFDKENLLSSLIGGWIEEKPIVIMNNGWMHPNIRKQDSVLCFSNNGRIICEKHFYILDEEREGIIKELKLLNINIENMFTGWAGLSIAISLDNIDWIGQEDLKSEKEIMNYFNNSMSLYNKKIIEYNANSATYAEKILCIKNTFMNIYFMKNKNENLYFLKHILSFLELEHYYNIDKLKDQKPKVFLGSPIDLKKECTLSYGEDTLSKLMEPRRVLTIDRKLQTFSHFISFLLDYGNWFNLKVIYDSNKLKGALEPVKDYTIERTLQEMKFSLDVSLDNWLSFLKNHFAEKPFLLFEDVYGFILETIKFIIPSDEIIFFDRDGKRIESNTEKKEVKHIIPSFLARLSVLMLLLCFDHKSRMYIYNHIPVLEKMIVYVNELFSAKRKGHTELKNLINKTINAPINKDLLKNQVSIEEITKNFRRIINKISIVYNQERK